MNRRRVRVRTRVPSQQQIAVLKTFLRHRDAGTYGYQITKATGIGPGTLYALLRRLFDAGHLERETELADGRCRIRYRLTPGGVSYAQRALLEDEYERGAAALEAS